MNGYRSDVRLRNIIAEEKVEMKSMVGGREFGVANCQQNEKNKMISRVVVGMIWLTGARGEIRVAVRTCEVGRYGEDVTMNEFSAVRKKKKKRFAVKKKNFSGRRIK